MDTQEIKILIEDSFHQAVWELVNRRFAAGWCCTRTLQKLREFEDEHGTSGAYRFVNWLFYTNKPPDELFGVLRQEGLLDLSFEYLTLLPEYRILFHQFVLERADYRLKRAA